MTHLYTILVGATVIVDRDGHDVAAMAWAEDTVIALGSEVDVRSASRGDSRILALGGATVVPLGYAADPCWPPDARLEVGGRANFAVLASDPRGFGDAPRRSLPSVAIIRGGHVVEGRLPEAGGGLGDEGSTHGEAASSERGRGGNPETRSAASVGEP